MENGIFWSEIGSGFGEPGCTPPLRIPRSTIRRSKITRQEGGIAASNVCLQSLQALPLSPSSPRDFLTLSPNLPIRQKLLSYTKRRLAWADKMHMSSTSFFLKFTLTFCLIAYRASALSSFQSFTDFSEYLTTIVAKNELSPVHSFCNYYSCRHSRR